VFWRFTWKSSASAAQKLHGQTQLLAAKLKANMSANSLPISLQRFAAALKELPLTSLYVKSKELHTSVAQLRSSNSQLAEFISASGPDKDCEDAIRENDETIQSMEARILAVEYEVVVERGQPWNAEAGGKELGKGSGDVKSSITLPTRNGGAEQGPTDHDDAGDAGVYL
jgi:hypothetical protein